MIRWWSEGEIREEVRIEVRECAGASERVVREDRERESEINARS